MVIRTGEKELTTWNQSSSADKYIGLYTDSIPNVKISRCSSPCHQEVKEGGYTSCACLKENDGYNIQTTAHAKLNFHHGSVQPQALLDLARSQIRMITIQMKDKPRANHNQLLSGIASLVGLFAKLSGRLGGSSKPYQTTEPTSSCLTKQHQHHTPKQCTNRTVHSITADWMAGNSRAKECILPSSGANEIWQSAPLWVSVISYYYSSLLTSGFKVVYHLSDRNSKLKEDNNSTQKALKIEF
ncbi:hypothetical protein DY000_02052166 [Brassica cretica]|uniref:Uncharacterized protein n=1 Tax=Brassica cretica TaxID=69181 RepID=A0ABQ7AL74_BRACR|nr:hypothetical protein DY000_02052166 [Brassica cretica]